MGWLDDWIKKLRGEATKRATEAATEATTQAASAAAQAALKKAGQAVTAVGEDFVGFAERELERATAERTAREERVKQVEEQAERKREDRASREARAKEELARLKAAMGKKDDD